MKSIWGWGLAERFPDRDARRAIGEQAGALLGFAPAGLADPIVGIEGVSMPKPRLEVPHGLVRMVRGDVESRARHTYGRGFPDLVRGFHGDFEGAPDLVAYPESEAEVAQVLEWCAHDGHTVIPFGGGTSVVGGVEPPPQRQNVVVSLDVGRLDRVREVDPISRAALIEAGATGPRLEAQLARSGLTLRHYPQSFEHSTLGGWIATRAGGHYATQRTRIDDFVEAVRMITPAGLFQTRRLPSSGAGPDPDRLVLGSEGIFGVITEAWVRVTERPRFRARAVLVFERLLDAVEGARAIVQAGLTPSNCRVLDGTEALLHGVRGDGSAVLLLAFESADHAPEEGMERAVALATKAGGRLDGRVRRSPDARSPGDGPGAASASPRTAEADDEKWREAFFQGPYLQNTMVSLGIVADTFETACTWDRFRDVHAGIVDAVEAVMRKTCGAGRVSCRITHVYPDGLAPYYTFLAPGHLDAARMLDTWGVLKRAASDAIVRLGATITHHHAVGRVHRPWYDRERPALFAAMLRAAKKEVDPRGILNPGVLID